MPDFIIIGGPNGAGKSTIFPAINSVSREPGSFEPEIIPSNNITNKFVRFIRPYKEEIPASKKIDKN